MRPLHVEGIGDDVAFLRAGAGVLFDERRPLPDARLRGDADVEREVGDQRGRAPQPDPEPEIVLFVQGRHLAQREGIVEILVAQPHVPASGQPTGRCRRRPDRRGRCATGRRGRQRGGDLTFGRG